MNEIRFSCTACGQPLVVSVDQANHNVQCPACEQVLTVPDAPPAPEPTPGAGKPSGLRLLPATGTAHQTGQASGSFCTHCGQALPPGAAFCAACGAATGNRRPGGPRSTTAPTTTTESLSENLAAGLSYLAGGLSGLVFLLTDKRPFVRFHAAQSLVLSATLLATYIFFPRLMGLGAVYFISSETGFTPPDLGWIRAMSLAYYAVGLLTSLSWLLCVVSAFAGRRFELPVIGDIADSIVS